MNGINEITNL